jgi:hypothetical protein
LIYGILNDSLMILPESVANAARDDLRGLCCVGGRVAVVNCGVEPGRSDGSGEFVEGGCDAKTAVAGFEPEFVVAAPQVLDEGMPCDDCPR